MKSYSKTPRKKIHSYLQNTLDPYYLQTGKTYLVKSLKFKNVWFEAVLIEQNHLLYFEPTKTSITKLKHLSKNTIYFSRTKAHSFNTIKEKRKY